MVTSPEAAISVELRLVSVDEVAPVTLVEPEVAPIVLLVDCWPLIDVSLEAIVPDVWPVLLPEVVVVSVDGWPCVEAVPAIAPLVLNEPEAVVEVLAVSVLEVLGEDEVVDGVPAIFWSCVERCAVCELWSGDVALEVELVEATELFWPVVSDDEDERGEDEVLAVLEGVED